MFPIRMSRHREPAFYPISSLHRYELGQSLPAPFLWHICQTSLSQLVPSRSPLNPVSFPPTLPPYNRNPHISQFTPSPDHALLAIVSNDSKVQLHEPVTDNSPSLRLTLLPRDQRLRDSSASWLRFAGSCWLAPNGNEALLLGFENRDSVWLYDLQSCGETKPTSRFSLESPADYHAIRKGARDIKAVDENVFLASTGMKLVRVFDVRSGVRPINNITTGMHNALLSPGGMHVYAGDCEAIAMYDMRMAESVKKHDGGGVKSFGGKTGAKRKAEIARKTPGGSGGLSYLGTLPGGVPGCLAYQAADGGVGYVDMAPEGHGVYIAEEELQNTAFDFDGELQDLGISDVLGKRTWYLTKRQCDIIRTPGGKGWLMVAPNVQRDGVRVVSLEPDLPSRSLVIAEGKDYSCVHVIAQKMERFALGGPGNNVEVLDIGATQTTQFAGEETA